MSELTPSLPPAEQNEPDQPQIDSKPIPVPEVHGPKGLEPTRYGDWERNGRCIDF